MTKYEQIKLGDWVEGEKTSGKVTSGYVTDIKENMLMLDNNRIIVGRIIRHRVNSIILIEKNRIVLNQATQYHPCSRSFMPDTIGNTHGKNIERKLFSY